MVSDLPYKCEGTPPGRHIRRIWECTSQALVGPRLQRNWEQQYQKGVTDPGTDTPFPITLFLTLASISFPHINGKALDSTPAAYRVLPISSLVSAASHRCMGATDGTPSPPDIERARRHGGASVKKSICAPPPTNDCGPRHRLRTFASLPVHSLIGAPRLARGYAMP